MKPLHKGLILALCHLLIVASLGAKLLMDRAQRPRVWMKTAPRDPDLPIRGRYVSLRLEVTARGFPLAPTVPRPKSGRAEEQRNWRLWWEWGRNRWATLSVEEGKLVAVAAAEGRGFPVQLAVRDGQTVALLEEPVAFFIPEHVPDPSIRPQGEELWVEVTLPKKGPPRPIRLGVKKGEQLTPLPLD